jgi:hypothetical protein
MRKCEEQPPAAALDAARSSRSQNCEFAPDGNSHRSFLISGDTAPERLRGHHLLRKPVRPMKLRNMLSQLLKSDNVAGAA